MTPEELRRLRERHGLSQAELARLIPVSVAAVGHWERGTRPISPIFVKWHEHMLLANSDARAGSGQPRLGRPPTAAEAKKAEAAARLEREQPIVCSIRFCEPDRGRPMDPLTFRPYRAVPQQYDLRRKPVDSYVFDDGEWDLKLPLNMPGRFPGVAKQMWCQSAFARLEEQLQAQLVAMGHLPQLARRYMVEAGAKWSWHKVETSRPECIVTLPGMRVLTAVS